MSSAEFSDELLAVMVVGGHWNDLISAFSEHTIGSARCFVSEKQMPESLRLAALLESIGLEVIGIALEVASFSLKKIFVSII